MQYQFQLIFALQGTPSEGLFHFVKAGEANIVLATQALGSSLIANPSNIHQLTIHISRLKKHVTFSTADCPDKIRRNMVLYNFACSLGSFTITHAVSSKENQFVIQMATDVKQDIELLKSIEKRFNKKS